MRVEFYRGSNVVKTVECDDAGIRVNELLADGEMVAFFDDDDDAWYDPEDHRRQFPYTEIEIT